MSIAKILLRKEQEREAKNASIVKKRRYKLFQARKQAYQNAINLTKNKTKNNNQE